MIDVRSPDLKWERGDFESEADHHEQQAEQEKFVVAHLRGDTGEVDEIKLARNSRDQRDAKNGEGG